MSDIFVTDMGKRIHEKRKSLRLSQDELAERAGLSKQTVSRAENGLRELGAQNVIRMAKALDMSADYLLTGERVDADLLKLDNKIASLNDRQYKFLEELIRSFTAMCEEGSV